MTNEIKKFIETLYTEESLIQAIDERIMDYIDYEQMEDEGIESEHEWYTDYGRGEAEDDVINSIIRGISKHINEPVDDWYFNDKYGDINEMIYECYPILQK